jgi:hypothetical protein
VKRLRAVVSVMSRAMMITSKDIEVRDMFKYSKRQMCWLVTGWRSFCCMECRATAEIWTAEFLLSVLIWDRDVFCYLD